MAESMPPARFSKSIADRPGASERLAPAAFEESAGGGFAARHPLLLFGLMPLPVTLCLFVMLGFGFWLAGECLGFKGEAVSRSVHVALAYSFVWLCRIIPFATAAALFTRAYVSSKVSHWWFVAAAAQVLLVAGLFDCRINYSDAPGKSSLFVGFPALSGMWPPSPHVLLMHVLQVAVPIGISFVIVRTARQRQSSLINC